jgi:hypothetical protein
MEHRLDTLAKALSRRLTRRQAFGRFASGLAIAALASIRARAASADDRDCGRFCAECCVKNLGLRGPELADCIRSCHAGEGLCGPIVCPGGH